MGVLENICSPLKSFPHSEKLESVAWLISDLWGMFRDISKLQVSLSLSLSYYDSEVPVGLVFRGPSMLYELPSLSLSVLLPTSAVALSKGWKWNQVVVPSCFGTRNGFPGRQFFHELGQGYGGRFGMIQAYYIYCALYF